MRLGFKVLIFVTVLFSIFLAGCVTGEQVRVLRTPASPTCTDECGPEGLQECFGDYLKVCGDHDIDSCLEWDAGVFCEFGCVDGECGTEPSEGECGNGIRENLEECDDTDMPLTTCSEFDQDVYESGNLGCYDITDDYGRGCTYDLSACECTTLKAKLRIFPLDGGPNDADSTQDGTTTIYSGIEVIFDASPSCGPLHPDYAYYYIFGDGYTQGYTANPIAIHAYNPSTFPHLYSPELQVIDVDWLQDTQIQTDAIRIISALEVKSKRALKEFSPARGFIYNNKIYTIGGWGFYYTDLSDLTDFLHSDPLIVKHGQPFEDVVFKNNYIFLLGRDKLEIYSPELELISFIDLDSAEFDGLDASRVAIKNNAMYISAGEAHSPPPSTDYGFILVYDISQINNPVHQRTIELYYDDNHHPVIEVSGDVLVAQDGEIGYETHKMAFFDISNELYPNRVSEIEGEMEAFLQGAGNVHGNIVWYNPSLEDKIKLIDFSDVEYPFVTSEIELGFTNSYLKGVVFNDKYLLFVKFISDVTPEKVYLYEIEDPANPLFIGNLVIDDLAPDGVPKSGYIYTSSDGREYYLIGSISYHGFEAIELFPDYAP